VASAAAAVFLIFTLAAVAQASPRSPHPQKAATKPEAKVALPPRITAAFRNIALKTSFTKLRAQRAYKDWSDSAVGELSKEFVKEWVKKRATECNNVLPWWFFCNRPPKPVWGRGVAVQIGGYWPGEFVSPWRVDRGLVGRLRPGRVFWLTCWSLGIKINNGWRYSNYWYKLTDGYWVSDAWLYTGTDKPLRGVAYCPASR
jgi:hypothetical protein